MPSVPRPSSVDKLIQRLQWDDLDPAHLRRLVEIARDEDLAGLGLRRRPARPGDFSTPGTAAVPRQGAAALVAREPLVVCGLRLVPLILSAFGGRAAAQFCARDGAGVPAGSVLATLHGDPRVLLTAERTILNFLQRLSGIATHTRRHVAALGSGRTRLLDTRQTTPGYRMLEKYAVACGGGWNHRLGLFDRVLLKDNHLALLGCGPAPQPFGVQGSRFGCSLHPARTQDSERRTLPPPWPRRWPPRGATRPGCRSKSRWITPVRFPPRFPPAPTSCCSTISPWRNCAGPSPSSPAGRSPRPAAASR